MTTFDPTKPVQTRDGRPARIICTDKIGKYSIAALVKEGDEEYFCAYDSDGRIYKHKDHESDLINIKSDDDRRSEIAEKITEISIVKFAIKRALEHINWPACAERP